MANQGRRRAGALAPDECSDGGRNESQGRDEDRGVSRSVVNPVIKVRKPKRSWNNSQVEAINWDKGPVVLSSCAGSGKTSSIVARIIKLIEKGVDPRSILATTFTKKAADEMNTRLKTQGIDTEDMAVQTMHAFCFRILKKNGFDKWEVDDADQYNIILKSVTGFKGMKWRGCDITLIEQFISLAKNSLVRPENIMSWPMFRGDPFYGDSRYIEAYVNAEGIRRSKKLITFDDMLIDGVEILENNQSERERIQEKFEYVIIDEFQDSNAAQIRWMELVSAPKWNLMVVGDSDQAIYEWRGALPEYMVKFAEKYNASTIKMGINYRCAPNIVNCAAKCIVHNELRTPQELSSHKTVDGRITCRDTADQDEEANVVADEIERLTSTEGMKWGDFFCLYRTNAQSRALEEVFSKRKYPYVVLGGGSFYQRKEVQDLLSYLKVLVNPRDTDAGRRAISRPFRYVAINIIDKIEEIESQEKTGFVEACRTCARLYNNRGVGEFYGLMQELQQKIANDTKAGQKNTVGEIINWIVGKTKFIDYLTQNEGSDTLENSRAANVGELIRSADRYFDIDEFLKFVVWQINQRKKQKNNDTSDVIQCMTFHKAKGLQHPAVFIVGVNQGILPHANASEPYEEERRLFYVGMTRAEEYLHISFVRALGMKGKTLEPSQFIEEAQLEITGLTLT